MNIASNLRQGASLLSICVLLVTSSFTIGEGAIAKPLTKPPKAAAQSSQQQGKPANTRLKFNPPSSSGNPQSGGTGIGRDDDRCPKQKPQSITYDRGFQTTLERPAFWVYLPYKVVEKPIRTNNQNEISSKAVLQFVVRAVGANKPLHKIDRPYPLTSPGFARLTLPDDKPLAPNVTYRWTVEIYCMGDRESSVSNPQDGYVQRVNLPGNLTQVGSSPATIEQLSAYGQYGLWYETIDALFAWRDSHPPEPEITDYLQKLLKQVGVTDPTAVQLPTSK